MNKGMEERVEKQMGDEMRCYKICNDDANKSAGRLGCILAGNGEREEC